MQDMTIFFCYVYFSSNLKLKSHGILHYLRTADLSEAFTAQNPENSPNFMV